MIVVDYSGTAIAAIMQFQEDLKRGDDVENIIRHVIINTIKMYKRQFKREFGNEIIIACDGRNYWRKDIFEYYKYRRKKDREKSDVPWELIHESMEMVKQDLINHFPYKVIQVNAAEADDVMAVMCMHIAPANKQSIGLYEDPEPVLLITSDKDMKQLWSEHVKIYLPRDKKFAKLEDSKKMFLRKLILTGDAGDGVPNVFSPNDSFFTGIRQKPATQKKMLPFLEAKNMTDATDDPLIKQRIIENARLISFSFIPDRVEQDIIAAYNVPPKGNKMTIFDYLARKGMKQMMNDIDDF